MTCLKVISFLLIDYPTASFGFIASRSIDEASQKVESYIKNQRFRIYSHLIFLNLERKLLRILFIASLRGYLLVNRLCAPIELKDKELVDMLSGTYNNLLDIGLWHIINCFYFRTRKV